MAGGSDGWSTGTPPRRLGRASGGVSGYGEACLGTGRRVWEACLERSVLGGVLRGGASQEGDPAPIHAVSPRATAHARATEWGSSRCEEASETCVTRLRSRRLSYAADVPRLRGTGRGGAAAASGDGATCLSRHRRRQGDVRLLLLRLLEERREVVWLRGGGRTVVLGVGGQQGGGWGEDGAAARRACDSSEKRTLSRFRRSSSACVTVDQTSISA